MDKSTAVQTEVETDWHVLSPDLQDGPLRPLFKKQLSSWELVLQSRSIPYRTEPYTNGRLLLVPVRYYKQAKHELQLFEKENHNWPPPLPVGIPPQENLLTTICVLFAVATFHNLTLLNIELVDHRPVDWLKLGNAHAGKVVSGEWWRLITALTLHVDWLHLIGNLAVGGLFISRLCRNLGAGLGWSLVLASGVFGNLFNAWIQQPDHQSVGASTAVFGAVGLVSAIGLVRYRLDLNKRWLLPFAAALALLAMLGTNGERTDLGAHLFGFISGLGLGFVTGLWLGNCGRPKSLSSLILGLCSAVLVLLAWWQALIFRGP